MSDLDDMFRVLTGCCLHNPQWQPGDVDKIVRWVGDRSTGCESSSIVIVRLQWNAQEKRCDYGLLTQSEDYTGHGCQCGSMTVRETSLYKLLSHLDEYELAKLVEGIEAS